MPKEVKTYECNHCRTSYNNVVLAETCEFSHQTILKVIPTYYKKASIIPDSIEVEFKDGSHATYSLPEN